jgi:hypothetical protein
MPKRSSMIRRSRSGSAAIARRTSCRRTESTASSSGLVAASSPNRSPSSPSSSEPTGRFSETFAWTASSASSTCPSSSSDSSASSSRVGLRPSLASSRASARDSFTRRSLTCVGMRIVADWFEIARWQAWRIHQVA